MIEIDGSYEEGGGQILRNALALSLITQKAFRIKNIRKNRPKPGLKPQQLSCIKACREFSNAVCTGMNIGSEEIEFIPKTIKNRQMEINIGTAGSITLLMQSMMFPMMFTDSELKVKGGTDVKWSMPIDYFKNVVMNVYKEYSEIDLSCEKRGYYPKGGGHITVKSKAKFKRKNFDSFKKFHQYIFGNPAISLFKQGRIMSIKGVSHASSNLQKYEVAEKQARQASIILGKEGPVSIETIYNNTESTGNGIVLYVIYKLDDGKQYRIGADSLAEKNQKARDTGNMAAEKLVKFIRKNIIVDEHLQDNIIPLLGLFGGKIKTGSITKHTKANIMVSEKFLGVKYNIENYNEANFISVLSSSNA